jgi:hypothetical protein
MGVRMARVRCPGRVRALWVSVAVAGLVSQAVVL